jgi:beta-lactamase class A
MDAFPRGLAAAGLVSLLLVAPQVRADDASDLEPPAFLELKLHQGELDVDPQWRDDASLQLRLEHALERLGLDELAADGRFSVALVDLADSEHPRLAQVNGTETLYAASVPKIAVLYAAYQAAREGRIDIDEDFERTLVDMIRVSSNSAASEAIQKVGFDYIASVLWQSRLYDPAAGGGLWVGKAYGGVNDRWHRDPVANASHGASALACARLLTLLAQERLVDTEASREMKRVLGDPGIHHKFVKGLERVQPEAQVFRKSGSWRQWHGDAALVEDGERRYVAVALCEDPRGGQLLERLIVELDACIPEPADSTVAKAAPSAGVAGL